MRSHLSESETRILTRIKEYLRSGSAPNLRPDLESQLAQQAATLVRDLLNSPQSLVEITGPVLKTPPVAQWFLMSRQGINKAVQEGRLLAIKRGRFWYFPSWQLVSQRKIPASIAQVLACFPAHYTPEMKAAWFIQPQTGLRGRTPAKCVNSGQQLAKVIQLAKHIFKLANQPV